MGRPANTPGTLWEWVRRGGENECWLWVGSTRKDGHGQFRLRFRMYGAHRAAWMLTRGAIPAGLCVLHTCGEPRCCNPEHLYLGTRVESARLRGARKVSA